MRRWSIRDLNRATLGRQGLLDPLSLSLNDAITRLGGLQAERSRGPYLGFRARDSKFPRDDLTGLIESGAVVRATWVRSTLHLVTAPQYTRLRTTIQPALTRALRAFYGRKADGLEIEQVVDIGRRFLEAGPRPLSELRAHFAEVLPDRDAETLTYAFRTQYPVVQSPMSGTWDSGAVSRYGLAEQSLDEPIDHDAHLDELIMSYLAAYGPASVKDFQQWSGMVRMGPAFEMLRTRLITVEDEAGRELFDLPEADAPDPDATVSPRFLPEFDNLLLAHADRTRVFADVHRSKIFLSAGRVRATFLLDGFVAGTWSLERSSKPGRLIIEPFAPLLRRDRDAIAEEAEVHGEFLGTDDESKIAIVFRDL